MRTSFFLDGKKRFVYGFKTKSISDFPILKKEFNSKKNNIDPELVGKMSNIKFHWKCKKGHEWQASPNSRFSNRYIFKSGKIRPKNKHSGCPYCSNQRTDNSNCLKTLHPELSKMWDDKKNDIGPDKVNSRSQKKYWWKCKNNHSFKKEVYLIVDQNGFCGGCGRKDGSYKTFVTKENSLEAKYPELTKEWHPTKNKPLKPKDVFKTTVMYWWKCPKGYDHVYKNNIFERANLGVGCPFCAFKKLTTTNTLQYMYPEIAKQWHPTKNGKMTPKKIAAHSSKHAWWKCKKGHEWKAIINTRTARGGGCSKCIGIGISYMEIRIYSELIEIFKDIEWSYKFRGYQCDLFIPQLKLALEVDGYYWHKKQKRINFDYKKNQFLTKNKINLIRIRENGLPLLNADNDINAYFTNPKINIIIDLLKKIQNFKLTKDISKKINAYKKNKNFVNNKLFRKICSNLPAPIFKNSLAYKRKKLKDEWDYKKNFPLVPSMFKLSSQIKVWWKCKNDHSFQATVSNRAVLKRNCPYCAGRYALPNFNLKLSFPKIANEWNYKLNLKKPEEFTPTSGQYVWWNCPDGHIYRKSIAHRTHIPVNKKTGRNFGCPCKAKHTNKKLFRPTVYPLLRNEFSKKNKKKLKFYHVTDKTKVIWKCKNGHEYKNSIYRRIFYQERCFECINNVILLVRPLHDKNETKMLD